VSGPRAVLVALVGEAAAVEGGGAEDEARERGEDAGPAAGEHDRGRRVAERQADEDGVEGGVVERAEPVLLAGVGAGLLRRAPCPLRRRRRAFLVHGRRGGMRGKRGKESEDFAADGRRAFLSRQIVQCAPFFRSFLRGKCKNLRQAKFPLSDGSMHGEVVRARVPRRDADRGSRRRRRVQDGKFGERRRWLPRQLGPAKFKNGLSI
jgi:hypothetical protein